MLTADSNLLIHAADPDSPHHEAARDFFASIHAGSEEFVLCELVLVEL
jgi:predicted nucleic acid-binding protein